MLFRPILLLSFLFIQACGWGGSSINLDNTPTSADATATCTSGDASSPSCAMLTSIQTICADAKKSSEKAADLKTAITTLTKDLPKCSPACTTGDKNPPYCCTVKDVASGLAALKSTSSTYLSDIVSACGKLDGIECTNNTTCNETDVKAGNCPGSECPAGTTCIDQDALRKATAAADIKTACNSCNLKEPCTQAWNNQLSETWYDEKVCTDCLWDNKCATGTDVGNFCQSYFTTGANAYPPTNKDTTDPTLCNFGDADSESFVPTCCSTSDLEKGLSNPDCRIQPKAVQATAPITLAQGSNPNTVNCDGCALMFDGSCLTSCLMQATTTGAQFCFGKTATPTDITTEIQTRLTTLYNDAKITVPTDISDENAIYYYCEYFNQVYKNKTQSNIANQLFVNKISSFCDSALKAANLATKVVPINGLKDMCEPLNTAGATYWTSTRSLCSLCPDNVQENTQ